MSPLEKRRLRSDLIALYSFLRRGSGEDSAEIYSLVSSGKGMDVWEWFRAAPEQGQTGPLEALIYIYLIF